MDKQIEHPRNVYRAPSSNLSIKSREKTEWSRSALRCAEKCSQCMWFAQVLAACAFVFIKIAVDSLVLGWQKGVMEGAAVPASVICLVILALGVPIVRCSIYYQRRKISIETFVEKYQKEIRRPLVLRFLTTSLVMSIFLLMFLSEDPSGFALTLISYFVALPITYAVTNATSKRAAVWLEQVLKTS